MEELLQEDWTQEMSLGELCIENENGYCMFCGAKMSDPTAILEA